MPGGRGESKQTSWGQGHSLPQGPGGGGGGRPQRDREGTSEAQAPLRGQGGGVSLLGAKTVQWGDPTVPRGWPQAGEGPETTPSRSPLTFYRIKGMSGREGKHQVGGA